MKKFSIKKLATVIAAVLEQDMSHELRVTGAARFITGVSIDSRTIQAGDCFFAIAGDNFNGHAYVADAFVRGAVCAVVSNDTERGGFTGPCVLKVSNTVKALGDFAREYRRQMNCKVVAITGSAGKTTTRHIC